MTQRLFWVILLMFLLISCNRNEIDYDYKQSSTLCVLIKVLFFCKCDLYNYILMKNDQCIFLCVFYMNISFIIKKLVKHLSCILSSFLNLKIFAYLCIRIVLYHIRTTKYHHLSCILSQSVNIPVRRTWCIIPEV